MIILKPLKENQRNLCMFCYRKKNDDHNKIISRWINLHLTQDKPYYQCDISLDFKYKNDFYHEFKHLFKKYGYEIDNDQSYVFQYIEHNNPIKVIRLSNIWFGRPSGFIDNKDRTPIKCDERISFTLIFMKII